MALNFLDKSQQQVDIPIGGTFTSSGFISSWYAAMLYRFYSEYPMPEEFKKKDGCMEGPVQNGFFHYFKNQDDAQKCAEQLGVEINPELCWHLESQVSNVLNLTEEAKAKFASGILSYDLRVKSLLSKKYRHEYHMIALPAAVNAMANLNGYETSGFDLTELIDQNTVFSDEFEAKMIGSPDAPNEDDEDYYTNSILWKRREALWASLGENNTKAFRLKGTETNFDTESDKLSSALEIASYPWTQPVYAHVVTAKDPRYDAVINNDPNRRLSIPAIVKIYNSKEEALVDANELLSAQQNTTETRTATSSATPDVPEAWKTIADQWLSNVTEFKKTHPNLNAPTLAMALSQLGVTEKELRAWWDRV